MKSKIIALALFVFTATGVAFYPVYQSIGATNTAALATPVVNPPTQDHSSIEVVFVLDTTGSMSGLIQAAKEKIWSIASTMASAQSAPEIRMGLVAYRDRGDAYVTKVLDLSDDLDSMYARLMDFQADGGGDGPESVNQALHDAVHHLSWSQDQNTYKVVFLVGDAPPHMNYQDDVKYPDTLAVAVKKGIVVNAIQSGQNQTTAAGWQQIAQLGQGRYFQVAQAGNAVAIATPFDKKIALLSEKLDHTRLYYGDAEEKEKQQSKVDATDKLHATSSFASRARRAVFNTSSSGKTNFLGEGELVDDIASGRVELSGIDKDQLPASMQAMAPAQQQALIEETAQRRNELQRQIEKLSDKRSDFLKKKVEETGGAGDSLDEKIYSAVREQAGRKGLRYEADAAAY
ncbi:MAG: vWA domain-containing protein [Thiogranum sp.]